MKSINLIILFLMAVLPTYARGNLHNQNNLQQQQEKKKKEHKVEIYGDVKDSFLTPAHSMCLMAPCSMLL